MEKSVSAKTKPGKALAPSSGKKFKLTLLRGLSRTPETQKRTLTALGLHRREHSVVISDNAANRGQILKIHHLISVEVLR